MKLRGYGQNKRRKLIAEGVRAQKKLESKESSEGNQANRSKGTLEEQVIRRLNEKVWFSKNQRPGELPCTTTLC